MDIVPVRLFPPASLGEVRDENIPLDVLDGVADNIRQRLEDLPEEGNQIVRNLRVHGGTVLRELAALRSFYVKGLSTEMQIITELVRNAVESFFNCFYDTFREGPAALPAIMAGGEVPLQVHQEPPPPPPPLQQGRHTPLATLLTHASNVLQYLCERKRWIIGGAAAGGVVAAGGAVAVGVTLAGPIVVGVGGGAVAGLAAKKIKDWRTQDPPHEHRD